VNISYVFMFLAAVGLMNYTLNYLGCIRKTREGQKVKLRERGQCLRKQSDQSPHAYGKYIQENVRIYSFGKGWDGRNGIVSLKKGSGDPFLVVFGFHGE